MLTIIASLIDNDGLTTIHAVIHAAQQSIVLSLRHLLLCSTFGDLLALHQSDNSYTWVSNSRLLTVFLRRVAQVAVIIFHFVLAAVLGLNRVQVPK